MKLSKKQTILVIGAAVLFFVLQIVIPIENGLTKTGKDFLCVFIPLIFLWMTIDTFVPSMIALAAFGLLGVAKPAALFQGSFGNLTVAIFLTASLLIVPTTKSGVMKKIAQWFLSQKITARKPYVFLLFVGLASFTLGGLINNAYSVFIMCPLIVSICESLGFQKGDRFYTAAFLEALWGALAGAIAFPFAKAIYLTLQSIADGYGFSISHADIMKIGIPLGLSFVLCGVAVIRLMLRPDAKKFYEYDPDMIRKEMKASPLTRQAKILAGGFAAMTLCWTMTIFSGLFGVASYLNSVGFAVINLTIVAALSLIQVDKKPVIDLRKTSSELNWGVIGFLSLIMYSASAMGASDNGINNFLIGIIGPSFSVLPPAALVAIGIPLAAVITSIISDNVTVVIVLSIFLPALFGANGISASSLTSFAVAVTMMSGMTCITPAAFPGGPLILGEHVSIKDSLLPNVVMCAISVGLCFIFF